MHYQDMLVTISLIKKTKEYLIKKYGNEVNHNLGFEEWERDLMKTPKEKKLEK